MEVLTTKEEGTINLELYCEAIHNVNHFAFTQRRGGKNYTVKTVDLETTQGTIRIEDTKARRQFMNQLGLSLRKIEKIPDYAKRNDQVKEAIEQRAFEELTEARKPLVFRCHTTPDPLVYAAWSIVTTDYVEVPTKEAISFFESVLTSRGLGNSKVTKQWDDGKAVCRTYDLWESPEKPKRIGDLAGAGVQLRAGYSGDRAVGLSSVWTVLACLNGMTSNRQVTAYRGIHRGMAKHEILNQLEQAFDIILAELPLLTEMVEKAKEPLEEDVERQMLKKILADYPDHIKKQITKKLEKDYKELEGTWRISQALSDVASHYHAATDNYKNQLSKAAYRVLVMTPQRKRT